MHTTRPPEDPDKPSRSPDSDRPGLRRAVLDQVGRPTAFWLAALVVAGLSHPFLPGYRWVLIHAFTLGVLGNSLLLWSERLSVRFLPRPRRGGREPDAPRERTEPTPRRRAVLFNLGAALMLAADLASEAWPDSWTLTVCGAGLIAVAAVVQALVIAGRLQRARRGGKSPRTASTVVGYVLAWLLMACGAAVGAFMAAGPEDLVTRLRPAHVCLMVLGFVGLSAAASLIVLFPALWRFNGLLRRPRLLLGGVAAATVLAAVGFAVDSAPVAAAGLALYAAGWAVGLAGWLPPALRAGRASYPSLSATCAVAWLVVIVAWYAVAVVLAGDAAQPAVPTTALLVAFGAQLLFGTVSHLVPVGLRHRAPAGTAVASRGAVFRVVLFNLSFAVWQLAENSWLKVLASFICVGVLVTVPVLLVRAARVQLAGEDAGAGAAGTAGDSADRTGRGGRSNGSDRSGEGSGTSGAAGQAGLAVALVALLVACFGGLSGAAGAAGPGGAGGSGGASAAAGDAADAVRVEVSAGDMVFSPEVVEVPAGAHVILELVNEDSTAHDLAMANGARSGRLTPGESTEVDLGVVEGTLEGWCTIAGHRTRGMTLTVHAA
ncbi:hypothetical protein CFRA_11160 [Corynebacterium frankenforstense DSM 45800]|uniref:EfeO-type cupredoxin-like domain-containing protein n=1 Tax=Corynebacterium frankenforstense DSM 45800 TaxID=1437875 RepID=A0A1L7CV59_9CORY|nr:cupredoxin domain-containing protein [Corynebacterium frankenforstense]APT89691.1 hypothetical protein CFRA_11160 [Corynebacterium frankenforstense DSM 45800]